MTATPSPSASPVANIDGAGALDVLRRFRDLMAEQPDGVMSHHHPIWVEVAETLSSALQPSSAADAKPVAWRYRDAWGQWAYCQAVDNTNGPTVITEKQPLYAQPQPSQQADPRLIEWGYADLEEAIVDLGRLIEDRDAFDGLASQQAGTEEMAVAIYNAIASRQTTPWSEASDYAKSEWRIVADRVLAALKTVEAG